MSFRGRKGARTHGGRSATGRTSASVPPITPTTDLLAQLSTYPPTFFTNLLNTPPLQHPQTHAMSSQTMPQTGPMYQFGQPASTSFHSLPIIGTSPQSAQVQAPAFQSFGEQMMMMLPTPSMPPHKLQSTTPSGSSKVPSASTSTCPSSSTPTAIESPVPESQPESSPSINTTTLKGKKKKRTNPNVQLPDGVGSIDEYGRLLIKPDGEEGFIPSDKAVKRVVDSMSPHYTHGWPTWGKVPVPVRNRMFQEFQNKCRWDAIYDHEIRPIFERKAAKRLGDSLSKYRLNGKVPKWIYKHNWEILERYWQTPEFIAQSEQAKKNRASAKGGSKHTGGSVSLATHRARFEAENGKVSDYDFYRLFHYLYDEEGNEVGWVEPRAEQLDENYKVLHQQWLESQGSHLEEGPLKPTPEEENAMFVQAGGGYNRNRAYGLGPSRYKKPSRVGIVTASCSSSSTPAPQNVDNDLHAKLEEMAQKLEESERQRLEDRENMKKLQEIVAKIWNDKEQGK